MTTLVTRRISEGCRHGVVVNTLASVLGWVTVRGQVNHRGTVHVHLCQVTVGLFFCFFVFIYIVLSLVAAIDDGE